MEMDNIFEKHLDEEEEDNMENGGIGEIEGEWEEDEDFSGLNQSGQSQGSIEAPAAGTAFGFENSNGHEVERHNKHMNQNKSQRSGGNSSQARKITTASSKRTSDAVMTATEDDERDGLDIQSLSVVEAEFLYNRTDEGKSAAEVALAQRTINLEAFHIIKVIGKGNDTSIIFYTLMFSRFILFKCAFLFSLYYYFFSFMGRI
jgi:hypothetical protein